MKKRNISVKSDFKTGFFYKFCLMLGIVLLIIYLSLMTIPLFIGGKEGTSQLFYELSQSDVSGSILAFSIIFLGVGVILYFFHCQFAKLAKIADEIEKDEDLK